MKKYPWDRKIVLLAVFLLAIQGSIVAQESCPDPSLFGQLPSMPDGSPRIWASDDVVGPGNSEMAAPYDDYVVTGPIGAVQWWGTEINLSAAPQVSGNRASNTFSITFYASDTSSGQNMPGAVVAHYGSIVATKEATGVEYVNPYYLIDKLKLYRYTAELPTPCTLNAGWIHIRGTLPGSSNGVIFIQISGRDGNEYMCEYNGADLPYRVRTGGRRDIAFCLIQAANLVPVPDVVGMMQAAAQDAIIAAGLTVGTISNYFTESIPAGQVVAQNPEGGAEAPELSPVDLVVASAMVSVPDVVEMTLYDAQVAINAAGLLTGSVIWVYNEEIPQGQVMFQSPGAGSLTPPNTTVNITVSRGPEPELPLGGMATIAVLAAALGVAGVVRQRRRP